MIHKQNIYLNLLILAGKTNDGHYRYFEQPNSTLYIKQTIEQFDKKTIRFYKR